MSAPTAVHQRHHLLDAMRALAALLVCAGHLRAVTMVDLAAVDSPGVASKLFYLLTGLGHQSVMVFFVLSGYLVGGSVLNAGRRFQWRPYAIARLSRLWTVLLPCLALTWAVDQWVLHTAPQVYGGDYAPLWHSAPQAGQYDSTWRTWWGNVFFVQTWLVPVFGSNGPLWSLANEFWYYALFPSLAMALGLCPATGARRLWGLSLVLGLMWCLPGDIVQGFGVWLMGVGVFLSQGRLKSPRLVHKVLSTILLMGAVVLSKWAAPQPWSSPWADWLLGAAVSLFLLTHLQSNRTGQASPQVQAFVERMSDISFSLYLSHFPLVMLIGALGYLNTTMQPSAWTVMAYLAWLAGLVMGGQAMWWLFERHTPTVRRMMAAL